MTTQAAPKLFRIRTEADFDRIPFDNGMAAVEVPAHLLDHIDMRDFDRGDSGRLSALLRSIRSNGYNPVEPIHVRIGRRGRWVVIDGGHRLTAARRVMREWLPNLFGKKVEICHTEGGQGHRPSAALDVETYLPF